MRGRGGPPWLLIVVTALAFTLLPLVGGSGDSSSERVELAATDHGAATSSVSSWPPAKRGKLRLQRQVIGMVSYNQWIKLGHRQTLADARALTSRRDVDIIAWQEAWKTRRTHRALRDQGWRTRRFPRSARELAVSWRHADWEFVSADSKRVAEGVKGGRYPFPDRFAVRVTLRHRATGQLLSVLNTHLPRKIEDVDRPGRWSATYNAARARMHLARWKQLWDNAPGRWVTGAGDFNIDARAEGNVRPRDGVSRVMAGRGTSSYDELGFRGLVPTHKDTGRYIDYVFISRKAARQGRLEFTGHRVLRGMNSDHRAVLARIALS